MRHRLNKRELNRNTSWQSMTYRQIARSILIYERIITTRKKAKASQTMVEHLITLGKENSLAAKRIAFSILNDHDLVNKLFNVIAPRYNAIKGGYSRILTLGTRRGDNALNVIFELTKKEIKERPKRQKKEKVQKQEEVPQQVITGQEDQKVVQPEVKPKIEVPKEQIKKEKKPQEKQQKAESKRFFKGIQRFFNKDK